MQIMEVRRKRLGTLIKQWGGPTNLANKLGLSGPSYLSQLRSKNRPITEKVARGIEAKLQLPPGWFDSLEPLKSNNANASYGEGLSVLQIATVDALIQACKRGAINDMDCAELITKFVSNCVKT